MIYIYIYIYIYISSQNGLKFNFSSRFLVLLQRFLHFGFWYLYIDPRNNPVTSK